MFWTDDPHRDFDRWDAEQQRRLKKFPKCESCEEPIVQEDAVCLDGCYYCDPCLKESRISIGGDD